MAQMELFSQMSANAAATTEVAVDAYYAHSFAGIRYYAADGTEVVPTAGSITIQAKAITHGKYEDVANHRIDATKSTQASWNGNVSHVRATPNNLSANVAKYELIIVCNRT